MWNRILEFLSLLFAPEKETDINKYQEQVVTPAPPVEEKPSMNILDQPVKFPYGKSSREKLETCHPDLIRIFHEISKYHDTTILCGHRNEYEQQDAFDKGYSGVQFPNSKHNQKPSVAIDAAPYPVDWEDIERFCYFAGKVRFIADRLFREGEITHELGWGGDWDRDECMRDDKERKALRDYPHYELVI